MQVINPWLQNKQHRIVAVDAKYDALYPVSVHKSKGNHAPLPAIYWYASTFPYRNGEWQHKWSMAIGRSLAG